MTTVHDPAVLDDPDGLDSDQLDCLDDNLQLLARHAGAPDHHGPFIRDWGFRDTGAAPVFAREQVEDRLRRDAGLAVTWHDPAPLSRHLARGRPVLCIADAYAMPWLPYAGHAHMDHSFVVTGIDAGQVHIVDAYHNDTAWGPARPTRTTVPEADLTALLGAEPRTATLEPAGPPAPPPPGDTLRDNAAHIGDAGALRGYVERIRGHAADPDVIEEVALACWLGVRSRTRYATWLTAHHGAEAGRRFAGQVAAAWRRASEQAYIAQLRAGRGKRVPTGVFDTLAGPVADAEATAATAHRQGDLP
ncbi:BtrH N-terminal domain-containing protein [Dactylosporangium sp. NBC_01737]|uniref:BtrH N-terminal domain-containing protein n=1 Tax=Dactylosporangium sp. NBC_01737 TaxID=2975959 RepID=UPI002E116C65|nr:BtrH N-terminal domain-containing protein [Dactylosporangium sp. NBC_01737]